MKAMTTKTLLDLNTRAAQKRFNRSMNHGILKDTVDPTGVHLVSSHFPHGDVECVRCQMLIKLRGLDEPLVAVLDVSFDDFARLKEHTAFMPAGVEV